MTKTGPIFSLPNIAEQYLDVLSSQQRYSSHTISNYKRDFTIFFSYISQQPSSFLSLSKKESRAFLSFLQKKKIPSSFYFTHDLCFKVFVEIWH